MFLSLFLILSCFYLFIGNEIGDSGASSLAEILKVNSTLTQLDLGNWFFVCQNVEGFLILLNDNNIGYSGIKSLWEAKQSNSTIKDLNIELIFPLIKSVFLSKSLFYNHFSWDSMLEMSKLLTGSSLTELDLSMSHDVLSFFFHFI